MSCLHQPFVFMAARFELECNTIDHIPITSSLVSAPLRFLFGLVEICAIPLFVSLQAFQSLMDGRISTLRGCRKWFLFASHGGANLLRSLIAFLPLLNLTLRFYDHQIGRFNYSGEKIRNFYPLNTTRSFHVY